MTAKDRNAARGQPCQIRLPGCNGGGETTVLCHYSLTGISGMGFKSPDWLAADGCNQCHDAVDNRRNCGLPRTEVRLAFAEGVFRTRYARENP